MVYRVHVDLAFKSRMDAEALWLVLIPFRAFAVDIAGGYFPEKRMVQMEECYHDEDPPSPCKILKTFSNE